MATCMPGAVEHLTSADVCKKVRGQRGTRGWLVPKVWGCAEAMPLEGHLGCHPNRHICSKLWAATFPPRRCCTPQYENIRHCKTLQPAFVTVSRIAVRHFAEGRNSPAYFS